jgi:phage baseplate assembly protein W
MILPDSIIAPDDGAINAEAAADKTYKIDFGKERIMGYADGIEAVKQAVEKILLTERFQYLIYDSDYGVELESLIGQPQGYVKADIKRRVTEALMQDDRIKNVTDFDIQFEGDIVNVSFTVMSAYGNLSEEVSINV